MSCYCSEKKSLKRMMTMNENSKKSWTEKSWMKSWMIGSKRMTMMKKRKSGLSYLRKLINDYLKTKS